MIKKTELLLLFRIKILLLMELFLVPKDQEMETKIQLPSQETYDTARKLIQSGEVVAFPTETIYGLGANALDEEAVKKIFEIKGRPSSNPLIVHIWEKHQISDLWSVENRFQQKIIDQLFPGPITLLLKKKDGIPKIVTANPFVGIRMPSNQIAQEFLKAVEVPIAAPSANISGKPSPTSAAMVFDNIEGKVELIIDGGDSDYGIESTVVKVDEEHWKGKIWILRPGFITKEDLELLFQGEDVEVEYTSKEKNLSPGTRFKHYNIDAEISIIEHLADIPLPIREKTAIIATGERFNREGSLFGRDPYFDQQGLELEWGTETNLSSCAHGLFDLYHYCEKQGIKKVYIQKLEESWLGFAIMNRVKRSAENTTGNSFYNH